MGCLWKTHLLTQPFPVWVWDSHAFSSLIYFNEWILWGMVYSCFNELFIMLLQVTRFSVGSSIPVQITKTRREQKGDLRNNTPSEHFKFPCIHRSVFTSNGEGTRQFLSKKGGSEEWMRSLDWLSLLRKLKGLALPQGSILKYRKTLGCMKVV